VAQTITPTMTPVTSTVTAETFLPRGIARREAPVGHRQPSAKDVTSEESAAIERIDQESAELDRKLRICRGC
jgi:hypothetical protein